MAPEARNDLVNKVEILLQRNSSGSASELLTLLHENVLQYLEHRNRSIFGNKILDERVRSFLFEKHHSIQSQAKNYFLLHLIYALVDGEAGLRALRGNTVLMDKLANLSIRSKKILAMAKMYQALVWNHANVFADILDDLEYIGVSHQLCHDIMLLRPQYVDACNCKLLDEREQRTTILNLSSEYEQVVDSSTNVTENSFFLYRALRYLGSFVYNTIHASRQPLSAPSDPHEQEMQALSTLDDWLVQLPIQHSIIRMINACLTGKIRANDKTREQLYTNLLFVSVILPADLQKPVWLSLQQAVFNPRLPWQRKTVREVFKVVSDEFLVAVEENAKPTHKGAGLKNGNAELYAELCIMAEKQEVFASGQVKKVINFLARVPGQAEPLLWSQIMPVVIHSLLEVKKQDKTNTKVVVTALNDIPSLLSELSAAMREKAWHDLRNSILPNLRSNQLDVCLAAVKCMHQVRKLLPETLIESLWEDCQVMKELLLYENSKLTYHALCTILGFAHTIAAKKIWQNYSDNIYKLLDGDDAIKALIWTKIPALLACLPSNSWKVNYEDLKKGLRSAVFSKDANLQKHAISALFDTWRLRPEKSTSNELDWFLSLCKDYVNSGEYWVAMANAIFCMVIELPEIERDIAWLSLQKPLYESFNSRTLDCEHDVYVRLVAMFYCMPEAFCEDLWPIVEVYFCREDVYALTHWKCICGNESEYEVISLANSLRRLPVELRQSATQKVFNSLVIHAQNKLDISNHSSSEKFEPSNLYAIESILRSTEGELFAYCWQRSQDLFVQAIQRGSHAVKDRAMNVWFTFGDLANFSIFDNSCVENLAVETKAALNVASDQYRQHQAATSVAALWRGVQARKSVAKLKQHVPTPDVPKPAKL